MGKSENIAEVDTENSEKKKPSAFPKGEETKNGHIDCKLKSLFKLQSYLTFGGRQSH